MEEISLPIKTYKDAFLNTRKLIAEADRVHRYKREGNLPELLKIVKSHNKENYAEVLESLRKQYIDLLFMHVQNKELAPVGKFSKDFLRAAIEHASLQNWSNQTQFGEMKAFVDELSEK